tara:strand:- start:21458 stop:22018 length:561 start_codon:yes stop_codon:yes gene_type:complete
MKFELILFGITGFLVYNTYYDGYLIKYFKFNRKYFEISGYLFIALTIYLFIKKHPNDSKNLMSYANNLIRYMPIDKDASSIINPIFDFTQSVYGEKQLEMTPQTKRMMRSGGNVGIDKQNRCVSQAKKKLIASQQSWRCGHCNNQLDHTYEVDHIVDLQYGGTNEVNNLVALCRNCHGKKTMNSKM